MTFKNLTSGLLSDFTSQVGYPPMVRSGHSQKQDLPVDVHVLLMGHTLIKPEESARSHEE